MTPLMKGVQREGSDLGYNVMICYVMACVD